MFLNECARLSALWLSGSVSLSHSLYPSRTLSRVSSMNELTYPCAPPPPCPSSAVSLDVGLSVLPALLLISPPHRTKIPNGTFWTQPNEADTVAYRCWSRSRSSSCCCCCRDSGALVLVPSCPLSPLTLTTPLQLLLPLLLPAHLIWAADMAREEGRLRGSTWVREGKG